MQYNHRVYTMILQSSPERAKKYLEDCKDSSIHDSKETESVDKRRLMVDYLKTKGVRVYPNYTYKKVLELYRQNRQ
jgi:tetrahydrodipicolinate N-succinyltransferase